jgi:predicted RNase H-like HicB family nuclease
LAGSEAPVNYRFAEAIEREDDDYVALCPELNVVSQGDTVATTRRNLLAALGLVFETAPPETVAWRLPAGALQDTP